MLIFKYTWQPVVTVVYADVCQVNEIVTEPKYDSVKSHMFQAQLIFLVVKN